MYYRWKIKNKNYLDFNIPAVKFEPCFLWPAYNKIDVFHDPSCKYIKIGKSRNIVINSRYFIERLWNRCYLKFIYPSSIEKFIYVQIFPFPENGIYAEIKR